jgi:ribosomal protein S18 acetylase RimI-like enzyme
MRWSVLINGSIPINPSLQNSITPIAERSGAKFDKFSCSDGEAMISSAKITLGPADPGNANLVPDLIFETNPYIWSYLFNGQRGAFDHWILGLFQKTKNTYSYDTATVAMAEGDLIGIEMGFAAEATNLRDQKTAEESLGLLDDTMIADMTKRGRFTGYLSPHVPANAYKLHTLSVANAGQNRGIGTLLLENAFEKALKAGLKSVHLNVYADNPAVHLYEKMGMKILIETRLPELARKQNIKTQYRMVREL